jgi:hypothetical protein
MNIKTKLIDNILNDYKNKIENLLNSNEEGLLKMKELEKIININKENENDLKSEIKIMQQNKIFLDTQIKNLNDNFIKEINEKKKYEEKYVNLMNLIKNIYMNLKELSKTKENSYFLKLTEKLKYFYSDIDINLNTTLMLSNCIDINNNNMNINVNNNINSKLISNNYDGKVSSKEKDTFILSNSNYQEDDNENLSDIN